MSIINFTITEPDAAPVTFTVTEASKGDKGDQGIQGVKGDTGAQGIQGIQGEAGNDANVTEANIIAALGINPKTDVISTFLSGATVDLVAGDTETFEAPYDFTLNSFWIAVTTAPTGSSLVVDLKRAGVSVTTTKAGIDSNEFSSLTGTAPVLTTTSFSRGDKITPSIFQVGSLETGKSLKIYLEITKI